MQSPKSPEYKAGYLSTSSVCVTPCPFVPCIVSKLEELSARAAGIIVLSRAREETNAVDHDADDNEGKRAIVEMELLV